MQAARIAKLAACLLLFFLYGSLAANTGEEMVPVYRGVASDQAHFNNQVAYGYAILGCANFHKAR